MGCGGSKQKPGKAKVADADNAPASKADDLVIEEVAKDDPPAGVSPNSKEQTSTGTSAAPIVATTAPETLLAGWDKPTENAAHARIIQTTQKASQPKQRGRPAIRNGKQSPDDADSSDDEQQKATASYAKPGESAEAVIPGQAEDRSLINMFRPRTPHAVMDLD